MLTVHWDEGHHWDGAMAVFSMQLLFRPIFCSRKRKLKKIKLISKMEYTLPRQSLSEVRHVGRIQLAFFSPDDFFNL